MKLLRFCTTIVLLCFILVAKAQNTYAVVIGLSKYKEVTPLLYADADAQAFVKYLLLDAQVPGTNVKSFINEQATRFNIVDEMYYLGKQLKPKDRLYFYFVGHGDLEADIGQENALLLLYNSFKKSYLKGTDYLHMYEIKDWLEGFVRKGVEVFFIADACHSGALIGGAEGKTKTDAALNSPWIGVNKLLACQPKESALEGRQWGGGRGLFSYYLVLGLQGFADGNKDKKVSLSELDVFLSTNIPKAAKPQFQKPVIVGNKAIFMSKVIPERVKKIEPPTGILANLINTRGEVGASNPELDRSLVNYYEKFLLALKEHRLLRPVDDCAEYYFNKLMAVVPPQVQQVLIAKFAPALEQSSNIIMQPITENGRTAFSGNWDDNLLATEELHLCLKLIGAEHPYYPTLSLKNQLLQLIHERSTPLPPGRGLQIKNEFLQLYKQYPKLPYLSNLLSSYYLTPAKIDSAEYFTNQALKLLPHASFIYSRLGSIYMIKKDTLRALVHYSKAIALDSAEVAHYMPLFLYHMRKKNFEEGLKWGEKALAIASRDTVTLNFEAEKSERMITMYSLMGSLLNAYHYTKNPAKFDHLLLRFNQYAWRDTTHIWGAHQLVQSLRFDTTQLMKNRIYQNATKLLDEMKAKVKPSENWAGWSATYGAIARYYKRYDVAEKMYLDEIQYRDDHSWVKPIYRAKSNEIGGFLNGYVDPYLELCILKIETGHPLEALQWLEKSMRLGCKRKDLYQNQYLTGPIQLLPDFKRLMDTYFPPINAEKK